eukprot:GHUV01049713.1.p1 GENE.GHUV01049713.1~~GHUV01049713.1.p1  ORF type:complete len:140 (-),score=2.63 GHUV01049713.1:316-735(-)
MTGGRGGLMGAPGFMEATVARYFIGYHYNVYAAQLASFSAEMTPSMPGGIELMSHENHCGVLLLICITAVCCLLWCPAGVTQHDWPHKDGPVHARWYRIQERHGSCLYYRHYGSAVTAASCFMLWCIGGATRFRSCLQT